MVGHTPERPLTGPLLNCFNIWRAAWREAKLHKISMVHLYGQGFLSLSLSLSLGSIHVRTFFVLLLGSVEVNELLVFLLVP